MRKHILITLTLFLTGCATTTQTPEKWQTDEGVTFDKENFSSNEYEKQGQECFMISQRMHTTNISMKKDGYIGCMKTRGYELTAMSPKKIQERNQSLNKYIEDRTYAKGKGFDKENFNDNAFVSDIKKCAHESHKIKTRKNTPIYSPNAATFLFSSILTGMANASEQRDTQKTYAMNCMFNKGYISTYLPEEEIERRMQLVRN